MSARSSRRSFLQAGAAAAAAWALRPLAAARKPNVVVIVTDDMGAGDVGFQGCRDIPTPYFDSLARNGVHCTHGYVSHPFCSPTRAGLMTGRYQQRFGHENNPAYLPEDDQVGLPADQVTFAQVMKSAGYVTGAVGKWHLGAAPSLHPERRGFDEYFGMIGGGHDYFKTEMVAKPTEYTIPMQRNGQPEPLKGYLTDVLGQEAEAFVRRHRDDPFFLYLAFNAPHGPLQATEDDLARFAGIADEKRRKYAAMVTAADRATGRVLDALRELRLEQDTLVFFLSDNGGPVGQQSNGSTNNGFRAGKGSVHEGGIRVPFAVQWRGTLPEGLTYEAPVIALDLLPTAAAAAGATAPEGVRWDGVNLLPALSGKAAAPPHDRLYWRTGGGTAWAVREGRWKLVKPGAQAEPQLYDLQVDPAEANNLAAAQPDRVKALRAAWEEWNKSNIAPRFQSPQPARRNQPAPRAPG